MPHFKTNKPMGTEIGTSFLLFKQPAWESYGKLNLRVTLCLLASDVWAYSVEFVISLFRDFLLFVYPFFFNSIDSLHNYYYI